MPMKLERWQGGAQVVRDLGGKMAIFWGVVQDIKPARQC